jgi:GAF domain-containing protein
VIDDPARLQVLADTHILDTEPADFFDHTVAMAAEAVGAPAAAITIVDCDRHIFWSSVGMATMTVYSPEVPLKRSVARHIVITGQPLIVPDARNSPMLHEHPTVLDGSLGAYLGLPLTSGSGHTIGALSVADPQPHYWGDSHLEILQHFATKIRDRIFA